MFPLLHRLLDRILAPWAPLEDPELEPGGSGNRITSLTVKIPEAEPEPEPEPGLWSGGALVVPAGNSSAGLPEAYSPDDDEVNDATD